MSENNDNFINVIRLINSNIKGKTVRADELIKSNPMFAHVGSKLIKDPNQQRSRNLFNEDTSGTARSSFDEIYRSIIADNDNSENILNLFPDIELSIQIIVSSIVAPKDMTSEEINYKFDDLTLPPDVAASILDLIETDIETHYSLKQTLPTLIRESLFTKGSYPMLIVPESSLDEIINSDLYPSTENINIKKDLGILSTEKMSGKEDSLLTKQLKNILEMDTLHITDNPDVLKIHTLKEKATMYKIRNVYNKRYNASVSLENLTIDNIFRESVKGSIIPVKTIKTKEDAKRKSLGRPMCIKIASEAVIPIHSPGDPSNHIGYYILLDGSGMPLNNVTDIGDNQSLNPINFTSQANGLTDKAAKNLTSMMSDKVGVAEIYNAYKEIVETQLVDKIKKGIHGKDITLADNNEVYFIMLSRALAGQKTNMLYVPKELLSYFAYRHKSNGVGKSLLDNIAILTSLRAVLLFSRTMSEAKSSIAVTKVNLTLDPNDPDPIKTIEMVRDNVLKLRQQFFPVGINNPATIVDWVHRAGIQMTYDNHPGIPNVKLDFENGSFDHNKPDQDLEDNLRKQTIQALGLSPETVDSGFNSEFATTVVANNLLLSKRIIMYQVEYERQLKQYVEKIIINDETLRYKIKKYLKDNSDRFKASVTETEMELFEKDPEEFYNYYIDKIASKLILSFSRPDTTNINNLMAEYDTHEQAVDKVINTIISSEFFSEDKVGDLSTHIDTIKMSYKTHFMRKWAAENNLLPELFDITKTDKDGKPIIEIIDIMADHEKSLMLSSGKYLQKLTDARLALNKDLKDIGVSDLESGEYSEGTVSQPSDDDSGYTDDDPVDEDTGEIKGMDVNF